MKEVVECVIRVCSVLYFLWDDHNSFDLFTAIRVMSIFFFCQFIRVGVIAQNEVSRM